MDNILIHENILLLPGSIKISIDILSIKIIHLLMENGLEGKNVFINSNCYSTFIYFKSILNKESYKFDRLTI